MTQREQQANAQLQEATVQRRMTKKGKPETSHASPKQKAPRTTMPTGVNPIALPPTGASSSSGPQEEPQPAQEPQPAPRVNTAYQGVTGGKMQMRVPAAIESMTNEQLLATAKAYNRYIRKHRQHIDLIPAYLLTSQNKFDANVVREELRHRIIATPPQPRN